MANYTIIPLKGGEFLQHERSTLVYFHGFGEKLVTPITMYLIQGEGRNILVDTGCGDEDWARRYHHPINQPEEMKVLNALLKVGLRPENIDCVVNTHLHWDHCFNNDLFPEKKIFVQKKELEFAADPIPMQYPYYETEHVGLVPPYRKVLGQYEIVEGDQNLYPGIDLVFIPGHTPGFQGVLVDTTAGKYLVASDCIGRFENWEGIGIHKHIPSAIHVDLAECYATFRKIEKICDYVLPGHDMRVFDHTSYP